MGKYVFVGTHAEIWDTPYKFSRFGQVAEMPDDVAKNAIASGCHLLSQADFDKIGFSKDELKKHNRIETHAKAAPEFIQKRHVAWKMLHGEMPLDPQTDTVQVT